MRLIDADALIPMMRYATTDSEIGVFPIKIGFDAIVEVINSQPTIEPERKKGKWIKDGNKWMCDECGELVYDDDQNFCPNCGSYNGGKEYVDE